LLRSDARGSDDRRDETDSSKSTHWVMGVRETSQTTEKR
jgi:hypothetical protein